ncbi:MAG: transcriptional regulator GcvA [Proteobacteria bacterium]|nr:transcriptional regulator GcvA [Pseudomonadota bacterium]
MRRLPPMSTLRSFEAAARHLSFSKAAEELYVTHGAVSRAVRTLEDFLNVQLFQRNIRSVVLTEAGKSYFEVVQALLDRLSDATVSLMEQQSNTILNVSTLDSFAAKWLVPRLFRFSAQYPDIDVRLSTSTQLANFAADGIDIVIRYGRGNYPKLVSELLLREELMPVCSPALLQGEHPLRCLADLRHHTLIHDEFPIDWVSWLRFAGASDIDARRGARFQSSLHAVQAAVQGAGVVLGRSALVADDLKAGRLVQPFTVSQPIDLAYYVVYPPNALERQKVKAFRDWLFIEARETSEQILQH